MSVARGARVEIRDLVVRRGANLVLEGVSLIVEPGELVVIVGPSGSGKSTLLACLNRLVEPASGSIEIDGQDIRASQVHLLRRSIGYAFQGVGLFPHLTVAENVAIVPRLLGWDRARIDARVTKLLLRVGLLPEHAARLPRELSGGQAQRVGVARALAGDPRLLLLDEPYGALDPETRARMQADLAAFRATLGVTTLLVSHDMGEALLLADRIAVMVAGRLVQIADPQTLFAAPQNDQVAALIEPARERARALVALERTI